MICSVYSYFDKVVGAYMPPFIVSNDKEMAVESIRRSIVKEPAKFFQLRDCQLYYLGTFDDQEGFFELCKKPDFLCDLCQFFPREEVLKDEQK